MGKFDGLVKGLEAKAMEEGEITNDGGLGDIGKKIKELIDSGEINKLEKGDLMKYYMSMVELSGNQKLINATKLSLMKKQKPELIRMIKFAANTAINFSK